MTRDDGSIIYDANFALCTTLFNCISAYCNPRVLNSSVCILPGQIAPKNLYFSTACSCSSFHYSNGMLTI
ncbi:uncharacterized protein ARMOST_09059 [Armillaria ostoyae]|uniref:Uncharacterized protein n=1 Tax=Armillaria ostoyae TaxID=47428 RepID=A0A284RAD1_ARMOS|nr:uncharacterized protein ARMOST_09059 [Armillaria ostoyae]